MPERLPNGEWRKISFVLALALLLGTFGKGGFMLMVLIVFIVAVSVNQKQYHDELEAFVCRKKK